MDAVNIAGDPADTNANGQLQPDEFLPEINGNQTFDECPPPDGDGFDHRTDDEFNALNGAQSTDVSFLSENDQCIGHIPMNTVSFEFDGEEAALKSKVSLSAVAPTTNSSNTKAVAFLLWIDKTQPRCFSHISSMDRNT